MELFYWCFIICDSSIELSQKIVKIYVIYIYINSVYLCYIICICFYMYLYLNDYYIFEQSKSIIISILLK